MEFLVEFDVQVPAGTSPSEVRDRENAESAAAAKLADEGHLVRLWRRPRVGDGATALGLYRADSEARLVALLSDLPLADWLRVTVTPLEPHPNDPPGAACQSGSGYAATAVAIVARVPATLRSPRGDDLSAVHSGSPLCSQSCPHHPVAAVDERRAARL